MTLRILVAEDAADVAEIVAFGARMTWPGCQVTVASSGAEALTIFREQGADLVVLDVELPPPNGFEVCRRIRETSRVPILMLTVRDATIDKVRAFDLGADDYLTKPFDHLELLARLRALVRRASATTAETRADVTVGDLAVNFTTHEVRIGGEVVALTSTEYRLLETLVRHAGTTVPHHLLLEQVWGPEYVGDAQYLKVFVRRLRQKLGDDAEQPRYIQTQWGVGYRFVPATRSASTG
ncbi:MAG: response regulator transcription factor [Chloroflexi bacterium]|nr:response regulator transcription factor [Chloroflexota bacterium]